MTVTTATRPATTTAHKSALRRLLHSPYFWAALAGVITMPLIRPLLRHEPAPPPVVGQLPSFSLVDQRGQVFGSAQLQGQVYVAGFLSASCAAPCPAVTRAMGELQDRYRRNNVEVKLVSFTLGAAGDEARRAKRPGRHGGAVVRRWTSLGGPPAEVREVVLEGFTAVGQRGQLGAEVADLASAGLLALVDRQGGLRGFYRVDERGLDEIYHRSRHVLKEGR